MNDDSSVFDGGVQDTGQPSVERLIARMETAAEGSRELDEDIAAALIGAVPELQEGGRRAWHLVTHWVSIEPVQCWTTSLDAALTLVPEGLDWKIISRRHTPYRGRWPYEALTDTGNLCVGVHFRTHSAFAMTAPLALCIAAMKARQTVPQTVGGDRPRQKNTDESNNNNRTASEGA